MRKMKKYCRRGFAMLLALTLCMGSMQSVAFAATEGSESTAVESSADTKETVKEEKQESSQPEKPEVSVEVVKVETSSQDSAADKPVSEAPAENNHTAADTSADTKTDSPAPAEDKQISQDTTEGDTSSQTPAENDTLKPDPAEGNTSEENSTESETTAQEVTEDETDSQTQAGEETSAAAAEEEETQEAGATETEAATESTETAAEASEANETENLAKASEEAKEENDEGTTKNPAETGENAEETKSDEWNITDTKRPEASEEVSHDKGTAEDKLNIKDKNWDIFYDADRDVYKITFNIDGKAEAATQVIDLTQALELLGQYAESGKQELQDKINALQKPELKTPIKPTEPEIGEPPQNPVPIPEEPKKPGKPEELDAVLAGFIDAAIKDSSILSDPDSAKEYLEQFKEEVGNDYIEKFAEYMLDVAKNANDKKVIETGQPVNRYNFLIEYLTPAGTWDDNGNRVTYTQEQRRQMAADYLEKKTPIEPEYQVDKESQAYKDYLEAQGEYERQLAEFNEWRETHEADYQEYVNALKAYNKAVEVAEAAYEAALAEYEKEQDEMKAEYVRALAEYEAAVKKLKADFERRIGANVLEPGDVKKFELFITSDSKHTYKYQTGSFTLATPEWDNKNGTVTGFDGQVLPDEYVDHAEYHITLRSEPIQKMLEKLGMDSYDRFNGGYPSYWDSYIKEFLSDYSGNTIAEQLNSYILSYYNNEYATIDELVKNNPDARAELTKTETSGNKWFKIGKEKFIVDAHLETVKYDTFYKQLFSFAFGQEADIKDILDKGKDSWTNNGYEQALYYYMDHKEIWQKTDAYFQALLDGGLSNEQATWTSLMMALNIDGELTGNDWQDTKWPWYSSIGLERLDIDFNLSKKDGETDEVITDSETEFQIYYIKEVKGEDGSTTNVNMYCTYDKESNSYTFVTTPSTVWTQKGELNISYALMKDIVYYLQEMTAPNGYQLDTDVYIVMTEEDYNKLTDEEKAALEHFDKFLDMKKSEDGLTANADFINVKIIVQDPETPNTPPERPERPERPSRPSGGSTPPPTTTIPNPVVPLTTIPNPEVPLANIPDEAVPLVSIMDEDVPLANVPKTGDNSAVWSAMALLSACCLLALGMLDKKQRKENNN